MRFLHWEGVLGSPVVLPVGDFMHDLKKISRDPETSFS